MIRTRHLLLKLFLVALVLGGLLLIYLDAKVTSTFTDKNIVAESKNAK